MSLIKKIKVILAKINVDENQGIASQLNIQSILTVYGFVDGKPIDAFQGAQPESKIEEMVNKMIEYTWQWIPKLIEEADKIFGEQKFEEALELFENLTGMDPETQNNSWDVALLPVETYDDVSGLTL